MKIKGAFPVRWQAEPGRDGTGVTIQQQTVKYAKSTSGTVRPTSGWQTTVPAVDDGQYLWTWVYVRYSDGTETNSYSVARQGIDGKGIQSSVVTYSQQATSVDPTTITNWGAFPSTLTDGYWLYTKTHIVYSDGATTDSYSVSQVGVGSYYAGCQEYYAAGVNDTDCPQGAAAAGTYVNGQTISTTWSTTKPTLDNSTPYLWNFEISADSRGNRYVTQAICIGNFAKGITSIVETYTISSHDNVTDMLADTAERTANPWTDEQHAAAPTQAKRYQWNKTVTSYNKGADDTSYHISAVAGIDGKGATYIDLDNENDSMLYDAQDNRVSGEVTSNIYLYSNGSRVNNPPAFSISSRSATIPADNASISGSILTVTGLTGNSGWVIVQCTYNSVVYTARFTVKKLVGVDKYELELTHNSVTYNETKAVLDVASIEVRVYRTAQNGSRVRVGTNSTSMSGFGLTAQVYPDGSSADAGDISFNSSGVGTVTLTAAFAAAHRNFAVVLKKDNVERDRETVPIAKVTDGDVGPGAVILDLDNENDSMLYDGTGTTLISGNVVSQAKLLVGGEDKTSEVTEWDCVDKSNVTASISNSGQITVTAMSGTSGSCKAKAKYNGEYYYAKLTLKKLVGVDKYELVVTPNALTYNTTTGAGASATANVKVYRTAQNGSRSLVTNLSDYSLKLYYYYTPDSGTESSAVQITDGTTSGKYKNGVDRTITASSNMRYRYVLLDANDTVLDVETIPISKTANGGEGQDSVIIDLDNENDSILYDGADSPISDPVVSNGSLYKGPTLVTSGVTWSIVSASCSGVTVMNNGSPTESTYARGSYPTAAWINSAGKVTVNGISGSQAKVVVRATYNSKTYDKDLTIKKLRGVDKYDLVVKPAALTYNSTTGLVNGSSSVTVRCEIWRTAQNGDRAIIDDFNGVNKYGLSIDVTPDGGSLSGASAKTYGLDFAVSSSLANAASSIAIVLKKGTMTHDSETLPIAKTVNGSGSAGPGAKSIYKISFEQPATPTGSSPQGSSNTDWRDDVVQQTDINIQQQGDWYRGNDGYMCAPSIGTSQQNIQTCQFVTTESNQKLYVRAKCHTSSYARMYIGNVDSIAPVSDYMRSISGSNQDTGDIEITVATPGAHFICFCYSRGSSGSDTYAKFMLGNMSTWKSDAKTYNSNGTVATWSTPYKVTADDAEQTVQTRANILQQTAFIATRMDKWDIKNGTTANGMDGRNSYLGSVDVTNPYKELLKQCVYDPSGAKPLLANTWYTLSFWAKAAAYLQFDKYITDYSYGFATETVYLQAGVQLTLWINGYCSSAARSAGKELRVFVYNSDWSWSTSVDITATSSTTKSLTFTVPETGQYKITAYCYSSGATSSQTVTLNWYRLNRGMRLMTYLWASASSNPGSDTCIDVNAGRIKDGQVIAGSPTDNNCEWQLSEVWTRHTLTFKTKSSFSALQSILFRLHQSSNGTYICMPKLEQGTVATAYVTNDEDIADLAADETGMPNDCGIWVESPTTPYKWNEKQRDYVAYEISGEWKRFFVKRKGMVVPNGTAPSAGGNSYWEEGSRISTLLTNTFIGANCNIGGFLASDQIFKSANEKLILDGVKGIIQMFHDEGYCWQVLEDGRQVLGVYTNDTVKGQHIQLDPMAREIRIYNESGINVTTVNGVTVSALADLFGGSSGTATLNSNKSGSNSISNGATQASDIYMTVTRNMCDFSTNNACRLSFNGTLSATGSQYQYKGSGPRVPDGYNNFAYITLRVLTYSDSGHNTLIKSTTVATASSLTSSSGYGTKTVTLNSLAVDIPAGYHRIGVDMFGEVYANQTTGRTASVTWNITSAAYVSDVYLSRLFANGAAYGSSMNNFFAAMNISGRMLIKAATLNGSGTGAKLNGFELSENGLSIMHCDKLVRPVVTLGWMRVRCSGTSSGASESLTSFVNGVRGSTGQPTVTRSSSGGVHTITYPADWTALNLDATRIIVNVNSYLYSTGYSGRSGICSIGTITATYCTFAVGDDDSPNDGWDAYVEIKYMLP